MTTNTIVIDHLDQLDPELSEALMQQPQGTWSDEAYLQVTESWNHLIELSDGCIEVLTMPTRKHQAILAYLFLLFNTLAQRMQGRAYFMGIRVRLWPRKFREPDIVFLLSSTDKRMQERYFEGADLVIEVVSDDPKDRKRDLVTKRREYAQAGILEYWIVDPQDEIVTVLQLKENQYVEHGVFTRGDIATSALLTDMQVDVGTMFDAE